MLFESFPFKVRAFLVYFWLVHKTNRKTNKKLKTSTGLRIFLSTWRAPSPGGVLQRWFFASNSNRQKDTFAEEMKYCFGMGLSCMYRRVEFLTRQLAACDLLNICLNITWLLVISMWESMLLSFPVDCLCLSLWTGIRSETPARTHTVLEVTFVIRMWPPWSCCASRNSHFTACQWYIKWRKDSVQSLVPSESSESSTHSCVD